MTHREPIDKVLAEVAEDREQLLAKLDITPARPQLRKHVRNVGWLRWHWWLTDDNQPDADLTAVINTAPTERSAWRRCHRAYLTELNS